MSLRVKAVVLTVACTALLAFAGPAFASSPAQNAYGGQGAAQNSRSQSVSNSAASQLPFTGLNAGLVVLAGVALLGGGLVLRRSVRPE